MKRDRRRRLAATALFAAAVATAPAAAQKQGGILHAGHFDSPASMSMLEEATLAVNRPVMGVFNSLVMFDQQVAQNGLQSIVPDLATGWSWNEEGTELTMPLRRGVKWHDGRPFTANDVKCTWNLLTGRGNDRLRINPRKSWYDNLDAVTANGDFEVTFRLKRPQPSFLTLLASGWSPVYPCHVPARDMRQHPIGTGPFKFVEFKPNQSITLARNPDYWKPGRPYLNGIEWTIIKDTSTRLLSFIAGQDVYFGVTFPQLQDVKEQLPDAICDDFLVNGSRNLIVNRGAPPFDNPELRRAMSLTLGRQAFIDIMGQGNGAIGGPMEPPPEGLWGMPAEMLKALPGYGPDVARRRAEARQIMEQLGYGPDKRLAVTVAAQCCGLAGPGTDPDRPAERDLYRWRARAGRHYAMVSTADAQGLQSRAQRHRKRGRRSRCAILRKLQLRRAAQLHRILLQVGRRVDRPAVVGNQRRQAAAAGLANRTEADRRRCAPGHPTCAASPAGGPIPKV
jgi:peptide/nickel transport system substrate-binding protein